MKVAWSRYAVCHSIDVNVEVCFCVFLFCVGAVVGVFGSRFAIIIGMILCGFVHTWMVSSFAAYRIKTLLFGCFRT